MYKENLVAGANPHEINMLMSLTPSPPTTLESMVEHGLAWDVEAEKDRYTLRYLCPVTQREQRKVYRRNDLIKIDQRLTQVLHVLSTDWSGKSIQNGLTRTVALWSSERQSLTHKEQVHHWETWESIAVEQSSVTYTLSMRTYELLDHSISGLQIAHPSPGHPKIRINSGDFEQQFPGVLGAIETAHLAELSPQDAAQYCLATLGFPNTSYAEQSNTPSLHALPDDLIL